jgi:hypothetical protein
MGKPLTPRLAAKRHGHERERERDNTGRASGTPGTRFWKAPGVCRRAVSLSL